MKQHLEGRCINVISGEIQPTRLEWENGRITGLTPINDREDLPYISPGFIDAHIHIESSLVPPSEFARLALPHGTVATVSDPHEIANVLGVPGIEFMIADGKRVPLKFFFGASSCVPATDQETAGAELSPSDIGQLLDHPDICYLAEVMNFPGVIHGDPKMTAIVAEARNRKLPIDGHSPGVMGKDLETYCAAGIQTDHECVREEEARARLQLGMKVAIREGSAARNFDALIPVLKDFPDQVFFCSDDKHPDELRIGHINQLIARAVATGIEPITALRAATLNPVQHYQLPVGLLQPDDPADFVVLNDLQHFQPVSTYIDGERVAHKGETSLPHLPVDTPNQFTITEEIPLDFHLPETGRPFPVIIAHDGQLITDREDIDPTTHEGAIVADPTRDLLKITVVNRYRQAPPSVGLIRNFGLREGAIASSVAHDSHNIVAVGASDEALEQVVRAVIRQRGGLALVDGKGHELILPLPIAGLMSDLPGAEAAARYETLNRRAAELGCPQRAPFMTISFMALLVIPRLKMSDLGIFDAEPFSLIQP